MRAETANLYALGNDPATPATYGKQIWKKSIGTAGIVPSVSMTTGGYVYTGNHAGEVKAFRISNGNLMWTTPGTSDSCGPTSDQTPCNDVTEVVIAQGRVFAANARGHLRVFKP